MKLFNIKLIIAFFLASSISAFAVVDVIHLGSFGKSGAWQAKEFKDGKFTLKNLEQECLLH